MFQPLCTMREILNQVLDKWLSDFESYLCSSFCFWVDLFVKSLRFTIVSFAATSIFKEMWSITILCRIITKSVFILALNDAYFRFVDSKAIHKMAPFLLLLQCLWKFLCNMHCVLFLPSGNHSQRLHGQIFVQRLVWLDCPTHQSRTA